MATDAEQLAQALAMSLEAENGPTTTTHEPKRLRTDDLPGEGSSGSTLMDTRLTLAEPGGVRFLRLRPVLVEHRQLGELVVEHGSSLSLIARGTEVLNSEFTAMDPEADWAKWSGLGSQIYFFCVTEAGSRSPACVLRCILDGDFSAQISPGSRRVVIDYLLSAERARGRGYAGRLLGLAHELAALTHANMHVLAIEDSCPYWMSKGFVLEEGRIGKRLNTFSDTHLLRLPSNVPDTFPHIESSSEEEEAEEEEEEEEEEEDDKTLLREKKRPR